jgi:hypothetical protein
MLLVSYMYMNIYAYIKIHLITHRNITGLCILRRTYRQDYETISLVIILSKHHHHYHHHYIAPVSGGPGGALAGTLTIMIGIFIYVCYLYHICDC